MKILIVEDEVRVATLLREALMDDGHHVDIANDGDRGEEMAVGGSYELLILDRLLPRRDGLTICRAVRGRDMDCAVLILTARDAIEDRIDGLDAGADDYLIKPFAVGEFLARVRALQRRGARPSDFVLKAGSVTLDVLARQATCDGVNVELTTREFQLLEYLMRNKGRTVTRTMIADNAWNTEVDSSTNVVDVYVNLLRNKADGLRKLIQTVRGEGYRLGDEG